MMIGITLPLNQSTKPRITSPMKLNTPSTISRNQPKFWYAKMTAPMMRPKRPSQAKVVTLALICARARPRIVPVWMPVMTCQAVVAAAPKATAAL